MFSQSVLGGDNHDHIHAIAAKVMSDWISAEK